MINMKKIFLVLCVVALSFGAISCQKECVCTITAPGVKPQVVREGNISSKKCKEAEKAGNDAGMGIAKVRCVME